MTTPVRTPSSRSVRSGVRACVHDPADQLAHEVLALHRALDAREHLRPGPQVDALFSRLVALAVAPRPAGVAEAVLAHPGVTAVLGSLRALCSAGEGEMERYWARHVLAAGDPAAALAAFPYLGNYRDLTRLEYHAVSAHLDRPLRRALFVGSGPLPLTALVLAAEHGVAVDGLDVDPEAVALGAGVARAVGVGGARFRAGDLRGTEDLSGYDVVCLAALVGLGAEEKDALLAHVRERVAPGALVLARSAHSLRGLLYPVLDPARLGGLEALSVVHPHTDVVNSVVVARRPAACEHFSAS